MAAVNTPLYVAEGSRDSRSTFAASMAFGGAVFALVYALTSLSNQHATQLAVQPRVATSSSVAAPLARVVPRAGVIPQAPEGAYQAAPEFRFHAGEPLSFEQAHVEVPAQEKNWGVVGLEMGALAAIFGTLLARMNGTPAQDRLDEDSEGGNVHFWPATLSTLLMAEPAFAADDTGYSKASYYVTLGTYVLALPGLYSLIKRSVKSKVVKKTYVLPGPAAPGGESQRELAGKLMFYFTTKRGFELKEAGQVVVFKGKLAEKKGQAAFLTFCVCAGLLSLALVLTIIEAATFGEGQGLGSLWYLIALASPLAGKFYLDNAGGEQEFSLKMVSSDDEMETEITVQGDDGEVEGLRLEYDWCEKGMVRVKGIFEDSVKGFE